MSDALVQLSNTALVVPPVEDYTGLGDIRITPTNITLVQAQTQDPGAARPGQFLNALSGEVYDEITVVLLSVSKPRVKFPAGSAFGEKPECRSNDGRVPSQYAKIPQSKTCATCSHSKWYNGNRPPCQESYRLLFVMKETGLPHYFQAKGMGYAPTTDMLKFIKADMMVRERQGTPYQMYDYYFTIGVHKGSGAKGIVYIPRYQKYAKVPLESRGAFAPLFQEYVIDRRLAAAEDEEVIADTKITDAVGDAVGETVEAEIVDA
jgi:hypothetical protein